MICYFMIIIPQRIIIFGIAAAILREKLCMFKNKKTLQWVGALN